MSELIDNVYKMIRIHEKSTWIKKEPEIVMICTPNFYMKLRRGKDNRVCYLGKKIQFNFIKLSILGIRIPLIIEELENNIEYKLMFRDDYEQTEKEKMYKKFMEMW